MMGCGAAEAMDLVLFVLLLQPSCVRMFSQRFWGFLFHDFYSPPGTALAEEGLLDTAERGGRLGLQYSCHMFV